VIGHRGVAGCAPENTLAGLRKASELNCRWVEFDVRLTADGQLILLHDERLERTTSGRGNAALLSLATVQRYDAGRRFGAAFRGERVPTLAEAVALLSELGIGANVELKAVRDREAETGAMAAALLCGLWPSQHPALLISSFSQKALAAVQACEPCSVPCREIGVSWPGGSVARRSMLITAACIPHLWLRSESRDTRCSLTRSMILGGRIRYSVGALLPCSRIFPIFLSPLRRAPHIHLLRPS